MPPLQTPSASESSGNLGPYRLVQELGRGGMGTVYKAYDPALDRYVAIKVLLEQFARDLQFLARFRQEAKAIARLDHPNILPIFHFGEEGSLLYIAMRYVEGGALEELVGQPLAPERAARLAMGIGRALGHAHKQGVVHRDVKPANVLLAEGDWPLLSDFGLARLMGDVARQTQSGVVVGTLAYMSPEQGQGEAVDGRSDLYSLGIMLYELLTGQTPFQAETPMAVLLKHLSTPLPRPRQVNPDIPEALEQLLLKATAKAPVGRYQTAEEMVEALERALAGLPMVVPAVPLPAEVSLTVQLPPSAPPPPLIQIPSPPEPSRPSLVADFIGREAELATYAKYLADAHLAVITGMAGVGKTALAAELARRAVPPERLFWHTLHEDEGVDSILWALAGFLARHGRDGLWRMLQTTRQTSAQPPPPEILFDYLFQLLRGQDCLLCLDDLHFVDDDPLFGQFVERLSQTLGEGGLSLIITSRRVPKLGQAVEVEPLTGLSAADAERLLARHGLSLPAALADELYRHTEGNAQLLRLTANLLKRAGDPARLLSRLAEVEDVQRYLAQEVDEGLSEDDREILIAVAILLGYPGTREAIERVAERHRIKRQLLRLSDQHLLVVVPEEPEETYGEHAIVREFYYDVPSRDERQSMHRRAGQYYASQESEQLKAALHYEQAGDYQRAAELASDDVWEAINHGQARPLGRLLSRLAARSLEPEAHVAVRIACGQVQAFLGEGEPARESFQAALAGLAGLPDSPAVCRDKARACLGMGELLSHESPRRALDWLERGLTWLGGVKEAETYRHEEAALRIRAGNVQWSMGKYAAALDLLHSGLALLPEGPSRWRAIGHLNLGNVYDDQGDARQATQHWEIALEISQTLHDYFRVLVIWSNLGIGKMMAGDWAGAVIDFQKAKALAEQLGSVADQARVENTLGMVYTRQGDEEAALSHLSDSLELARRHNLRINLPYVLSSLAIFHIGRGEWGAAESSLSEAERVALETDTRYPLAEIYYSWAQARLAQGDLPAAQNYVERALALARERGLAREEGISLGIRGQVLLASGEPGPAQAAFEESLAILAGRDPYEAARVRAAWGRYLAAGPDVERGAALLEEAQAAFRALGAKRDLAAL